MRYLEELSSFSYGRATIAFIVDRSLMPAHFDIGNRHPFLVGVGTLNTSCLLENEPLALCQRLGRLSSAYICRLGQTRVAGLQHILQIPSQHRRVSTNEKAGVYALENKKL